MITKNLDVGDKLINGTLGTIRKLELVLTFTVIEKEEYISNVMMNPQEINIKTED